MSQIIATNSSVDNTTMNGEAKEANYLPDLDDKDPYYFVARSTVVQDQLAWEIRIRDELNPSMNNHLTELMHAITKSRMLEAKARASEAEARATEARARSFEAKVRAGLYVVPPIFAVCTLAMLVFVLRVYGYELVTP